MLCVVGCGLCVVSYDGGEEAIRDVWVRYVFGLW